MVDVEVQASTDDKKLGWIKAVLCHFTGDKLMIIRGQKQQLKITHFEALP